MGLSHAIARGIYIGLGKKHGEFVRTAKSRRLHKKPSAFSSVREELLLLIAIVLAIFGVLQIVEQVSAVLRHQELDLYLAGTPLLTHYIEGKLWVAILAAQAIPYISALIGATVAARSGEKAG
jgi:hypothetical protein